MQAKITKRVVDSTRPQDRDVFVWDTEARGFGLKVTPTGRKIYIVQYRLNGGPTRRFKIGVHGSPWTPDGARAQAIQVLSTVARGEDPAEARRQAKADISLAELCDLYLKEGVRTKKASTIEMDRSRINSHVKPLLGRRALKGLTKSDIERFVADVAAGKTVKNEKTKPRGRAHVRGGKVVANRSLGMLGAILQFAVDRNLRSDNPARNVPKFKENRRTRFLSGREIARLGLALREAEAAGANPYPIAAIRLLILTGCRKNEILTLKWREVDLVSGLLRLPDSKTGAKEVYLNTPAIEVLKALPRQAGNPYVICGGSSDGHFVGLQKVWSAIRDTAKLGNARLHDLRHSFASVGASTGQSLPIIGKVLGHRTPAATSRYANVSADPARDASEAIAQTITRHLNATVLN